MRTRRFDQYLEALQRLLEQRLLMKKVLAGVASQPQFGKSDDAGTRIRRLLLKDALAGLTVQRGKTFKVEVTVEGEKLTDGDIALHIEEADSTRRRPGQTRRGAPCARQEGGNPLVGERNQGRL